MIKQKLKSAIDIGMERVKTGNLISGVAGARMQYDVVAAPLNPSGGRKRRPPTIEKRNEDGIMVPRHRLGAIGLTRDMIRNSPQARGMAKTLRTNVVGNYGKLRFNQTGGWYDEAQKWFNSKWSKHADFFDGTTFRECLQLVVYAITHEGDFVAVFDDGIISGGNGTGKLAFYEADRICNLTENDFLPFKAKGYTQDSGIIYDKNGRHVGVICSSARGVTECNKDSALILTRDPDADPNTVPWVHVRRKFRLQQGRGVGDAVTSLQTVVDSYEMLGYEMQSAKVAAGRYATVFERDAPDDDSPAGFDGLEEAPIDGSEPTEPVQDEFVARGLERYTGGNVDYMNQGDDIKFDPANRPNSQLEPFLNYTTDLAGAAHGLAHAYARQRADTSYTAFRGDMVMSWMSFKDFQQFLEDGFSDWCVYQVISWAVIKGDVAVPPENWNDYTAWQYPTMPAVDEGKEQKALGEKLRNGLTRYRELIGPHWKEHFAELAEEIAEAKRLGLPLSIFDGVPAEVIQTLATDNED